MGPDVMVQIVDKVRIIRDTSVQHRADRRVGLIQTDDN